MFVVIKEANSVEFQGFYGNETKRGCLRLNISQNDATELNLQGFINTWARSGQNSIKPTVGNWSNWWRSARLKSVYFVESVLAVIIFHRSRYKQVTSNYEFIFRLSQNEANGTCTNCFEFFTLRESHSRRYLSDFNVWKILLQKFLSFSLKQAWIQKFAKFLKHLISKCHEI